jgi:hypothetical protein
MEHELFVRCTPMQWNEVQEVAIAIVHACWAIRNESCPICVAHEEERCFRRENACEMAKRYQ